MAQASYERRVCWCVVGFAIAAGCTSSSRDFGEPGSSGGAGGSDASLESGGAPSTGGFSGASAGGEPPASGGSAAGGAGGSDGGSAGAGEDGGADSGARVDPEGYVRMNGWHGYAWTEASPTASIERRRGSGFPVCASGVVPVTADATGFATLSVNLNQAAEPADSPAERVAPTSSGVIVHVRNPAASPLRLVARSAFTGDSWCQPLYGGGGFYPWSSFRTRCTTTSGGPYGGKQPLTAISVVVPGSNDAPVPFDFCIDEISEAETGPVGGCNADSPLCTPALIDDFEGHEGTIYSHDGRSGHWYAYDDFSADGGARTIELQGSPGYLSDHALHSKGSGYTVWGSGLAVRLNQPPGAPKGHAYDASRYAGFKFWYRSKSPIGVRVRTLAVTSKSDPFVQGGTCPEGINECTAFLYEAPAVEEWTELKLRWEDIKAPVWSQFPDLVLDPKTVVELRLETYVDVTFDYAIDDLAFF